MSVLSREQLKSRGSGLKGFINSPLTQTRFNARRAFSRGDRSPSLSLDSQPHTSASDNWLERLNRRRDSFDKHGIIRISRNWRKERDKQLIQCARSTGNKASAVAAGLDVFDFDHVKDADSLAAAAADAVAYVLTAHESVDHSSQKLAATHTSDIAVPVPDESLLKSQFSENSSSVASKMSTTFQISDHLKHSHVNRQSKKTSFVDFSYSRNKSFHQANVKLEEALSGTNRSQPSETNRNQPSETSKDSNIPHHEIVYIDKVDHSKLLHEYEQLDEEMQILEDELRALLMDDDDQYKNVDIEKKKLQIEEKIRNIENRMEIIEDHGMINDEENVGDIPIECKVNATSINNDNNVILQNNISENFPVSNKNSTIGFALHHSSKKPSSQESPIDTIDTKHTTNAIDTNDAKDTKDIKNTRDDDMNNDNMISQKVKPKGLLEMQMSIDEIWENVVKTPVKIPDSKKRENSISTSVSLFEKRSHLMEGIWSSPVQKLEKGFQNDNEDIDFNTIPGALAAAIKATSKGTSHPDYQDVSPLVASGSALNAVKVVQQINKEVSHSSYSNKIYRVQTNSTRGNARIRASAASAARQRKKSQPSKITRVSSAQQRKKSNTSNITNRIINDNVNKGDEIPMRRKHSYGGNLNVKYAF